MKSRSKQTQTLGICDFSYDAERKSFQDIFGPKWFREVHGDPIPKGIESPQQKSPKKHKSKDAFFHERLLTSHYDGSLLEFLEEKNLQYLPWEPATLNS